MRRKRRVQFCSWHRSNSESRRVHQVLTAGAFAPEAACVCESIVHGWSAAGRVAWRTCMNEHLLHCHIKPACHVCLGKPRLVAGWLHVRSAGVMTTTYAKKIRNTHRFMLHTGCVCTEVTFRDSKISTRSFQLWIRYAGSRASCDHQSGKRRSTFIKTSDGNSVITKCIDDRLSHPLKIWNTNSLCQKSMGASSTNGYNNCLVKTCTFKNKFWNDATTSFIPL